MSVIAVKIKIMPSSLEADLEEIKERVKEIVEVGDGKNPRFEEESIAFGLKAVIATFAWPETKELDGLEESLREVEDVSSVEILDIRRAIG